IPLRIASSYTMPQFLYAEGMVPPKELYEDLQNETAARIEEARVIAHEAFPDLKIGHTIAEGSPIDMLLELSHDVTMIVMARAVWAACLAWLWVRCQPTLYLTLKIGRAHV